VRWPHNPVGYMTPGMNSDERQIGVSPGEDGGGFIGYFMDPHTNPVLDFVDRNFDLVGELGKTASRIGFNKYNAPELVSQIYKRFDARDELFELRPG